MAATQTSNKDLGAHSKVQTVDAFKDVYSCVVERDVHWGEMDAFAHVNNSVYFKYFEDVRIAHFAQAGVMDEMQSNQWGPILAHTECRFRFPLEYPDQLLVGSRISDLESDRFVMHYGVFSRTHGQVAATGLGRIVYYDYAQGRKQDIPESIAQRIRQERP